MKTALLRLLSSMKFWTVLLGITTSLGAKYGLEVDPEVYWSIVGLFGLLIGAQGLNDHGKAKAEIENRNVQSGRVTFGTLFDVLFMVGGTVCIVGSIACAALKSETKHAASDVVDCMTPQLASAAGELGSVLEKSIPALLSDTGKVDNAGFKALVGDLKSDAAGCAITMAISRLSKPRDQGAPFASPLTVDVPELEATWANARREQFGGRTFALGAGS